MGLTYSRSPGRASKKWLRSLVALLRSAQRGICRAFAHLLEGLLQWRRAAYRRNMQPRFWSSRFRSSQSLLSWAFSALCLAGCSQSTTQNSNGTDDGSTVDAGQVDMVDPERERVRLLVLRHAPILYLHPSERYLPSSAEWFLERATLFGPTGLVIRAAPPVASLPVTTEGFYLTIPDAARGGDLASALAYVHPHRGAGFTDLQFWFFYAYNGQGTLNIDPPLVPSFDVDLAPFGEHTGDWEHVTLRVDDTTEALQSVYLSQHSGGEWVTDPMKDMEFESGRPVVYSSRNGHASYRKAGMNLSETGSSLGNDYGLRNDTARGSRLDCAASFRIVADNEAPLTFSGRWGPQIDNSPFVTDVVAKIPLIGSSIAESTIAQERVSNGPTSPASKSAWTGNE